MLAKFMRTLNEKQEDVFISALHVASVTPGPNGTANITTTATANGLHIINVDEDVDTVANRLTSVFKRSLPS